LGDQTVFTGFSAKSAIFRLANLEKISDAKIQIGIDAHKILLINYLSTNKLILGVVMNLDFCFVKLIC
jgi:hypothetical protein